MASGPIYILLMFKLTTGCIPARLKCLFVIEDAKWSVTGPLALVQMLPTGPIYRTAGMVIVEEMHEPPMQPLHDTSAMGSPLAAVMIHEWIVACTCVDHRAIHLQNTYL